MKCPYCHEDTIDVLTSFIGDPKYREGSILYCHNCDTTWTRTTTFPDEKEMRKVEVLSIRRKHLDRI